MPRLRQWAADLGFSALGVSDVDLSLAEPGLLAWLEAGFHGGMDYMASHGLKRARPAELVPGTVRVITVRMDYLPQGTPAHWREDSERLMAQPRQAYVSRYARGRDYHKVLRGRLQKLGERLQQELGVLGFRAFTDSAPVLEVELAQRSGLGWRGKHTLVLSREAGSMSFLGEVFVDCPLPVTPATTPHCGQCTACLDVCPTAAIVAPYRLDARRCISYLTIEHDGGIPLPLREAFGNRIYGCDDCQLACPWNKFAQRAVLPDFDERPHWRDPQLLAMLRWTPEAFLSRTEGSPIRRIGWWRWQRNLLVAAGNALRVQDWPEARALLAEQSAWWSGLGQGDEILSEHLAWALSQAQHLGKGQEQSPA